MKPLSEQLADMSARAKRAEDAAAAARAETRTQLEARREQARASATAAITKVDQDLSGAKDAADRRWDALRAKVASDIDSVKAKMSQQAHERDVHHAEDRADWLEEDAAYAIAYAVSSIEQAQLAVLDAIDARREAIVAKNA